jgi:hypothetical protein
MHEGKREAMVLFPEQALNAGSYRGESAGLMAIHLLLLAINEVHPGLKGSITIFSDCISGLDKVQNLPPTGYLPAAGTRIYSKSSWSIAPTCPSPNTIGTSRCTRMMAPNTTSSPENPN